jgi:restriction system protein
MYNQTMKRFTPKAFEVYVADYLRRMAHLEGWKKPSFRVLNRELMRREEGAFELDVTVRFRALKLNFLVLVECKHYHPGHKVPCDAVMLLYAKLKTLDAHKGVVFSTSGFQKGPSCSRRSVELPWLTAVHATRSQ